MEGKRSRVRELSHSFPDEIIEEILTRLPVKSLLRFRCVSKSWLSLISSPTFIKAHLKNGINNSMHLQNRLLCISSYPGNHFIEFSFRFIFHAEVDSITSDYNISDPDLPMRIVGSCRGMVCVVLNEDDLYLWNPSIRKYELLPGLHISLGFGFYMKDGFGYDEFNDDYKVVAISYCIFYNGPYDVHIFSLKTNAWKRIEDFICGNPIDRSGKFASGKLHWLVDNDGCLEIVSLNLSSERYGKMGTPHSSANSSRFVALEYDNPCLTLGLFSESLCMLFDDHKRCMDLWVMKEYGITDSWTRIFRMPHLGNPEIFPHMLRIWLLNDHEMLFVYGCVIIICSLGYNGYRYTPINYLLAINQGDVFVESLVSPCVESSDE